jgi:hypothetical protein
MLAGRLVNMQTITRHGGGSHYVRPDRVYRTGVLTSTMNYDPNQDVEDVAAAFTQYPIDMSVPPSVGMSGLGAAFGANNMGLLQKWYLRFKAWRARRSMMAGAGYNFAQGMGGLGNANPIGVAYPQIGQQIEPVQVSKAAMAAVLMSGGMEQGFARAQAGQSWNRFWTQRWNG